MKHLLPLDDPIEAAFLARRRRVQFRMIGVVVGLLVLALVLVGIKVGRHLLAAAWLESNNYRVAWGRESAHRQFGGATAVTLTRPHVATDGSPGRLVDLACLTRLQRVEELSLAPAFGLKDGDLTVLNLLPDLQILNLDRSRPPEWLLYDETARLTDATMARIGQLRDLVELNLGGQLITDVGLTHLKGHQRLRDLDLRRTKISDAGLAHLKGLASLKLLDVTGTRVTAEGIQQFEAVRPEVHVIDDSKP